MRIAASRKHAVSWLLLLLVALLAGCSHELNQEEMRKRAFRRTTVDEEEEQAEKPRPGTQVATSEGPGSEGPGSEGPGSEGAGLEGARADEANDSQASAQTRGASSGSGAVARSGDPAATAPAPRPAAPASNAPPQGTGSASTAADEAADGAAIDSSISTTLGPPETPLSEEERRELTRRNLDQIGVALGAYTAKNDRMPAAAIDQRGVPLLSWRVELLPYLGLEKLHAQFRLNEPWNSRHNLSLLPLIPAVYQSPERFDERTNYLANLEVFKTRAIYMRRIEDGPENTAAILEVDDERAVPWTRPDDWDLSQAAPVAGLGNLRGGGFFAVSAAGQVVWLPIPPDPRELIPAFTPDTGERAGLLSLMAAADGYVPSTPSPATAPPAASSTGDPRGPQPNALATGGTARPAPPPAAPARTTTGNASRSGNASRPGDSSATGNGYIRPPSDRTPVPGLLKQRAARQLFRDIYGDEYAEAQEETEKRKFADKLMETVPEVRSDAPSHYVLLEIIKDVSLQGDDLETALEAVEELGSTYAVDHHELRRRTIASFVQKRTSSRKGRQDRKLKEHALRYSEEALRDEAFHDAEELCNLAIAAVGDRDDDKELIDRIAERRDVIKETAQAKREAEEALEKLEEIPDDVASQLALGRYLCFFAGDWANGLPILARSSTGTLQEVVQRELANPSEPVEQATLGDLWWARAGRAEPGEELASKRRAVQWYERAVPGLPGGLQKVKIQKRLEEFEQEEQDRQDLISER